MSWFNSYDRKARLAPGLLVVLPIAVAVVAGGIRESPVVAFVAGAFTSAGMPVVLVSLVRSAGLKAERNLLSRWGGWPTTQCLRHESSAFNAHRREVWRREVAELTGGDLPTAEEEATAPQASDERYEAAVATLRELTRDKKRFELVFEENKNYGFERNFYAVRKWGRAVALLSIAALTLLLLFGSSISTDLSAASLVVGVLVCLGIMVMWIVVPSEARVKAVSDRYAERLLDSCAVVKTERN